MKVIPTDFESWSEELESLRDKSDGGSSGGMGDAPWSIFAGVKESRKSSKKSNGIDEELKEDEEPDIRHLSTLRESLIVPENEFYDEVSE